MRADKNNTLILSAASLLCFFATAFRQRGATPCDVEQPCTSVSATGRNTAPHSQLKLEKRSHLPFWQSADLRPAHILPGFGADPHHFAHLDKGRHARGQSRLQLGVLHLVGCRGPF